MLILFGGERELLATSDDMGANRVSFFLLNQSYESLPPNFSLTQNMVAGAFAGIAVHTILLSYYYS